MLRLYGLRLGGRLIACWYGLAGRTTLYYYLGGFDPQLGQLSPGALLLDHALHEAMLRQRRTTAVGRGARPRRHERSRFDDHAIGRERAQRIAAHGRRDVLRLDGTYHNLGAFFDKISKVPRIISISDLSITSKDKPLPNSTITAECTATTFVLLETPASGTPAAASTPVPAGNTGR